MLYNDYLKKLSERFERKLLDMESVYNFDKGPEFEFAICDILRAFLPLQYGVCRGFVVSSTGETAGDDIIIYDQSKFPTLRLTEKSSFARKEMIPVEAVYAYIEAKHTLNKETLQVAFKQIGKIKEVCDLRDKWVIADNWDELLPMHKNPVFTMIFARHTTGTEIGPEINLLDSQGQKYLPETIIAGANLISQIFHYDADSIQQPILFQLENKRCQHFTLQTPNMAYGIGLTSLIAAIDWIRLGPIHWVDTINEAHTKFLPKH